MGAHNSAPLCDLGVFVEEAAEAVASADPDVWARAWVGKWPQRCCLGEGAVRAMFVEVPFVLGRHRGGVPPVDDEDGSVALSDRW